MVGVEKNVNSKRFSNVPKELGVVLATLMLHCVTWCLVSAHTTWAPCTVHVMTLFYVMKGSDFTVHRSSALREM